jgi:type II restriction enzyme
MKEISTYRSLGLENSDEVFNYLMETFHDNLREWDYFVNWDKAFSNASKARELVHQWDALIGVENFNEAFRALLRQNPELSTTIPLLVVRDGSNTKKFSIVTENPDWRAGLRHFDFSRPALSDEDIEIALEFVAKTGLKRIFEPLGVSNFSDYLLGAEAGLDSHGRKGRGGSAMTRIVTRALESLCEDCGFQIAAEVYPKNIEALWSADLSGFDSNRRFDFAINANGRVFVFEVNAYGGGGSKLKATAGEYMGLQEEIRRTSATFIWITEGAGWKTAHIPLRKAFDSIDHVLNLRLIEQGALAEIVGG